MFKWLLDMIEEVRWGEAADPSRWVKFVRRQVRLYFYILRELVRNRYPQQAAALTFTTLLSLVPLLAVAFSFFRGFAALEGVETRAQDAIFRTLLAGPLLERQTHAASERELPPEDPARLAGMSAEQLLAEADRRPRSAAVGQTLRLYVRALNLGAEAPAVRRGMSTLRLSAVPDLRQVLAGMEGRAQERYLQAAGCGPPARPLRGAALEAAEEGFQSALRLRRSGLGEEALQAVLEAEARGYCSAATRQAVAEMHEARAAELDPPEAVPQYRAALLAYCDSLVLATRLPREKMPSSASRHEAAVDALGRALADLGRRDAARYEALSDRTTPEAEQALQKAAQELSEAASLLVHSSEVRGELGKLYQTAGRSEEAARAYQVAFETSREVAARGISVAVVDHIRAFMEKVGRLEIGILGVVFLLVTATSLFNTIEKTLNQIWQVTERRPFWGKFTSFCTLIWLGPALIGTSIWAQERLGGYVVSRLGDLVVLGDLVRVAAAAGERLLPFLATWFVLVVLYKFLPYTRVKLSSVAWGAFLSALLVTAAKPLFGFYMLHAVRYEKIYGSLGAVPIFLLWVWLLWMIVLFGAEVAFAIQNIGLLQYRDKLHQLSRVFIDRHLAARTMMYVAREFWETGRPVAAQRLAEIMQITPEEASDGAVRLVRLGLLTPVGDERNEFHPARDLSRLRLSEVLSVTDRFRDESRSARPEDRVYEEKLEGAFRAAIRAQDDALHDMTFRDLLLECERDRGKYPKGPEPAG